METLAKQEIKRYPHAAYELGRAACRRVLNQAPYASVNQSLETYNIEVARKSGDKIIESNSRDLYRVPESKSMNIMTSGLDSNTALALIFIDKNSKRNVYIQNYDKSDEGNIKSIDTLSEALYHDIPKDTTFDRAIVLTQSKIDNNGNTLDSPENKLLIKSLSQAFRIAMSERSENDVDLQVLTYKKRDISENAITLRIECLPDGLTNILVRDEVIMP